LKVLIQRVNSASLIVDDKVLANIKKGLLLYVGFEKNDSVEKIRINLKKVLNYKVFPGTSSKMSKSYLDISGELMIIPQVTLALDTKKGTKPNFSHAADRDSSLRMFQAFKQEIKGYNLEGHYGIFGADMTIRSENDGPVTFLFD
tara:strand:+ start:15076 stop:15510 length:435 start_codon:yes stop_codon:yes gene_type:complete